MALTKKEFIAHLAAQMINGNKLYRKNKTDFNSQYEAWKLSKQNEVPVPDTAVNNQE